MKHGPVERALGAVLTFFAALGPAHAAASAPAAPVVHAAPQATLPLNDILRGEWDIALGRLADGTAYEPRIPYVNAYTGGSVSPAYAAHLHHNENPLNGVTVNAVLTDPTGNTHTYPCWYGEDMAVDMSGGKGDEQADYLERPTGYAGWHLAYPCRTPGAWTGRLTITDAGGTASGPAFTFTVAGRLPFPDAAKGRLSVAPDTRYLRYDDGDAYLPLGETANFGTRGLTHLAAARLSHARTLIRWWQTRYAGAFGVTGGADYQLTPYGAASGMTSEDAHSGRYSYKVTSSGGGLNGGGSFGYYSPQGQSEKFGVWVRDVGAPAGTRVGITQYANYGPGTLTATDAAGADIHDGAWHYVLGTLGASIGSPKLVSLTVQNADGSPNTAGYFLFDDLTIVEQPHDPSAGPGSAWDLLGGDGAYELQNTLGQPGCAAQQAFLDQCRLGDANALLEFYSCLDQVQMSINPDGSNASALVNLQGPTVGNQMGAYAAGPSSVTDDGTETAVGLMHAQQVRDWVARFGAYVGQGIAYVAYANETPITGPGGVEQTGPEHWAVQMRAVTADCLPLCGVDTYFNGTGGDWSPNLYESPWLQFAEPHIATTGPNGTTGTYATPLNMTPNGWLQPGVTRHTTGGPNGQGYVEYAAGARPNPSGPGVQIPTLRTPGTWTLSCWATTVPDAAGRAYNNAGQAQGYHDGLYMRYAGQPNYDSQCQIPDAGLPAWTRLSGTFTLAAAHAPAVAPQVDFSNVQAAGDVRYADITLTDPNGRVFWHFTGDEPLLDAGAGDAVSIWGEPYDVGVSGEPGADRPVVIGESESFQGSPTLRDGVMTNSVAFPMSQYALRSAAAMVDARWHADTLWYEDSDAVDAGGYGTFFHTLQSLLDAFLVPDGSWREAPTAQSGFTGPGEPFVVYGQENSRDAVSGGVVDATKAVVSVLPVQPDPASPHAYLPGTGLVDVQGLADAPYTVQEYDAATGQLAATLTASSAGHHLSLNFNNLAAGMVVKVSPVSAPALAVRLAVDHATAKPGDVVTYTLTYTNTGTGPALAVTVPWAVPAHMQFLSAAGGTYDSAANVVNWNLGTLAPGASGSVVLKARVQ